MDATKIAPEKPLDGLLLKNISGNCLKGISLANIVRAKLRNIHVTGYKGALLTQTNVHELSIRNVK